MSSAIPGKKIIAVLPAYHAVKTLKRTYEAIPEDWVDEIVLVDDASSDDTAALARSLGIRTVVHAHNLGYGGNQKTCYREALVLGADIIIMIHPDFQYDPAFAPGLLRPLAEGRADAMFGSRMLIPGGARAGGMPWWKFISNIGLTAAGNAVLGLNLSEYHSGFRAYSRAVLERAPFELNSDNFVFDTEIIVQLKVAGFRVGEIPITTKYFPEASMVGFFRSAQYGFSFLGVLVKYILWRLGLVSVRAFIPLVQLRGAKCPACGSVRFQSVYPERRPAVSTAPRSAYRITETGKEHGRILRCTGCLLTFTPLQPGRLISIPLETEFLTGQGAGRSGESKKAHWRPRSLDRVVTGFAPDTPAAEIYAYYRDQDFDQEYMLEEPGRRMAARRCLKKLSSFYPGGVIGRKLLDFGSGPGFFVDEARRLGWQTVGIESGKVWERFAAERFKSGVIRAGGLEILREFPAAHFDVITAWDVIEHLENPFEFLRLARDKLAPGGILALSTPNIGSAVSRLAGERWHALLFSHLIYFERSTLFRMLNQAGLDVAATRTYTRFFSLAYLFGRLGLRKMPFFFRRIIVPVNFFDEFEVYCRRNDPVGNGGIRN